MCRLILFLILLLGVIPLQAQTSAAPTGGSVCVVAKEQGNSLAIEWVVGEQSISQAITSAKSTLNAQGFAHVFPQAKSAIPHGWIVVVKTAYKTVTGRVRTSYGCGFSQESAHAAEQLAVSDLRAYSWGWKPEYGYAKVEVKRY